MKKIIINTDIGGDFDDLLALNLVLNSPEIDLLGVVTTKEHIRDKAKFTRKLLNLAGRSDIPVFYDSQLKFKDGKYISVYDYDFLTPNELNLDDNSMNISNNGIDFIIDTIEKNPYEVTLVSIAPNTNLAEAIKKNPAIISRIKNIYLMGGTLNKTQENINRPEHNYMRDRKSFDYVTNCGIPTFLVTRDITRDLFLKPSDIKVNNDSSAIQNKIYELSQKFLKYMKRDSLRLSDPITLGSLIFPELYKGISVNLLKERGKQGEIVYCNPTKNSNITAFYDFDRERFYQNLINRSFNSI